MLWKQKQITADQPVKQEDVAAVINRDQGTFSRLLKGKIKSPSPDVLNALAQYFGVSYEQLIGNEPITIDIYDNSNIDCVTDNSEIYQVTHKEVINIPHFEVSASMGTGTVPSGYMEIIRSMTVDRSWLTARGVYVSNPSKLSIITGTGDSMEDTFSHGDALLIDTGVNQLHADGIYAFTLNEFLYIKRLQQMPDGSIKAISDNRKYEPFVIDKSSRDTLHIHGKVLLAWNTNRL